MARNILASRLRALTEQGVLEIAPASDGSAYQEYVLTPKGEDLFTVVVGLRQWGEQHLFARREKHSTLIERASGKPVPRISLHDQDGQALRPQDTIVKKVNAAESLMIRNCIVRSASAAMPESRPGITGEQKKWRHQS